MSDPFDVCDLSFPSLITLREIAMNKIVIELWRQEIQKHRSNGTLKKLVFKKSISCSVLHPYVPPVLLASVDKKISRLGKSIQNWVDFYTENHIFQCHVLSDFDDLVCDFDCSIHYENTAKRMMQCDKISEISKFKIACLSGFEDDIALLWPSVSSQFHYKDTYEDYLLHYWVCRMRNEMYKIPFFRVVECDIRMKNEEELGEWLMENRVRLRIGSFYESLIFWTYMNYKISVDDFIRIINRTLRNSGASIEEILPEIWISAPDRLKQQAIRRLIRESPFVLFLESNSNSDFSDMPTHLIKFLFYALLEASYQDRRLFWDKYSTELLQITDTKEFQELMAIRFENDTEIIRFKETAGFVYWRFRGYFGALLETSNFQKLNEVLNFCVIGEQNIKRVHLRLLIQTLDFEVVAFHKSVFEEADYFNEFINNAYDDDELATEFKIQLLSSARFAGSLRHYIRLGWWRFWREFIETLSPSETIVKNLKKDVILPSLQQCLSRGCYLSKPEDLDYPDLLRWCLENDDEIAEFKQTLPIDAIVHREILLERDRKREQNIKDNEVVVPISIQDGQGGYS